MATPRIEAEKGAFADVVLMPGDPMRAKLIAETYLEDWTLVNQVRGMLGYLRSLAIVCFGIPETELIKAKMLDVDGFDPEKLVEEAIAKIKKQSISRNPAKI